MQRTPEDHARSAYFAGDKQAALDILIREYGKALHRYCLSLLRDPDLADDVYQIVLLQALQGMKTLFSCTSFRAWLYTLARHRCLDTLKVSRGREQHLARESEALDAPSPGGTPEDWLLHEADRAALLESLQRLPAQAREALLLRYYEQLSYEEMARRCGEKPTTLRVRVSRALAQLGQQFCRWRAHAP